MDYRLLNAMGIDSYYHPFTPETASKVDDVWNQLTNNAKGSVEICEVA